MKYTITALLIFTLILSGLSSFAETQVPSVYAEFADAGYLTLNEACTKIEQFETDNAEILELQETLKNLQLCDGRYVQLPDEEGTGKIYSADITFYLNKGTPYCNIKYTNYGGTISDGIVEVSPSENYLFVAHPEGAFYSNSTVFTLEFAPNQLHIQWGDGVCDYTLVRGTQEQQASANQDPPFVETDMYATLMQSIDKAFGGMEHTAYYAEETKTLTVYVGFGAGYKALLTTKAAALQETWENVISNIVTFSENVDEALTLATRKGLKDFTQAQFTIIFVEKAEPNRAYNEDDYLAVITDGIVTYNIIDETLKSATAAAQSTTIGEKNALKQAKLYLDVMSFSYKGLIEQLEYEGYSYSEAKYGADNCGADWYRQAAKAAENYLDIMPFSRSGLIDQLEYDGYTYDQAVYGVEKNGY